MNPLIYRSMYWSFVTLGRPFGGIPPRRITHWLANKVFKNRPLREEEYRWYRDRWGSEFRLNPYYFLDQNVIAFGAFEPHLQRFLTRHVKPGMVCFDVGANIGVMAVLIGRRVGPDGKVYAFEPVPHVRARLNAHTARNGLGDVVEVNPIALSDRDGEANMAIASELVDNQGMGSLVNNSCLELTEKLAVRTMTVDSFVAEKGITRIDLMKIDIQGAEPLLLAGGAHVFGDLSPDLLMEVSPGDLAGIGRTHRDLIAQIEGYGYRIYVIDKTGKASQQIRPDQLPGGESSSEVYDVYCTKSK